MNFMIFVSASGKIIGSNIQAISEDLKLPENANEFTHCYPKEEDNTFKRTYRIGKELRTRFDFLTAEAESYSVSFENNRAYFSALDKDITLVENREELMQVFENEMMKVNAVEKSGKTR